jgi:hypothetical protein
VRPITQHFCNSASVPYRNENAAWTAENVPILLTCSTDRWRVDDWHQLIEMIEHCTVEQRLITVLKPEQENISLEIGRLCPHILQNPQSLFLLRMDARREKSAKPKSIPFFFIKSSSFV